MIRDPWDPYWARSQSGRHVLTSVEITATNYCNLRCEHCAVGDLLTTKREQHLDVEIITNQLDLIPTLETFSITGGEPTYSVERLHRFVVPLLEYAKKRNLSTQINTNVTLPMDRYNLLLPLVDVFHISYNYLDASDFHEIAFEKSNHPVERDVAERLYQTMNTNVTELAALGAFVSAESIITERTAERLGAINHQLKRLGVRRHEIHPLYPSDFARSMRLLSLDELRLSIARLLDERVPDMWMLFGTLPFFWCSHIPDDRVLLKRLADAPNVTVRNDPDGRNRVNINGITGEIVVQDFNALEPLGFIHQDRAAQAFDAWQASKAFAKYNCFCPEALCTGPNLIVADTYYRGIDFRARRAVMPESKSAIATSFPIA